jgi:DNA-binding NarL/FixJ family response regulator
MTLSDLLKRSDYASAIADCTATVSAAQDEAAAVAILNLTATRMGADAAAFVSFVKDDDSHESFRFLLACDPVWCAEYERRAWYATDPWLAYARSHTEPTRGAAIVPRSDAEREIVALASEHGFRDALVVPAPSSGMVTRVGVLCLGSEQADFFADPGYAVLKPLARALAMELHAWWIEHIRQDMLVVARLTPDDLALLRHERHGLGTKEIGAALNLTIDAVNSRFQRMNYRLGVPNRRAAAQLAAEYGLI